MDFWDQIIGAIDGTLEGIHTCMPALVERYDSATCQCDCQPLLNKNFTFLFEDGVHVPNTENKGSPIPIIQNVPVVWPRTGDFIMHAPLVKRRDCVLLVFSERAMDKWLYGNQPTKPVTPTERRQFDITDAIAIPGLFTFGQSSPVDSSDEAQIWYKDAVVRFDKSGGIDFNNGNLRVEK